MADFEFLTDAGRKMLTSGYCQPGESIPQMYERVTTAIGQRLGRPDIGKKAYEYAAKGYLCFSTPILCNMGTDRGYPISCYGTHISDDYYSLVHADVELAMLSRYGGGVALDTQWIRPRGAPVRNLGKSRGVIPWCVKYDATTRAANQGEVRSAASVVWLNIEHPDAEDFMRIRRIEGRKAFTDPKMICHVINHGMIISRDFVARVRSGDPEARRLWKELMVTRSETGEPYIMFSDNANDNVPKVYKDKGLRVNQSNLCFVGDTKLLTDSGYRTLKALWDEGLNTVARNGVIDNNKTIKIVNSHGIATSTVVYRVAETAPVFKLTLENGQTIKATADHKFIKVNDAGAEERVMLSELRPDDKIPYQPYHAEAFGSLDARAYALLSGYVIGNGSISISKKSGQQRAHIRLWNENIDACKDEILAALESLDCQEKQSVGTPPKYELVPKYMPQFNYYRAEKSSHVLGRMMKEDGLVPGNKHQVPARLWNANEATISSFLRGLFSADAYALVRPASLSIRFGQKNYELLADVQLLMLQLGIPSRIHSRRKAGTGLMNNAKGGMSEYKQAAFYELIVNGRENCVRYMEKVGFIQTAKVQKVQDWLTMHQGSNNSATRTKVKVVSVEPAGEEAVYCLTEPVNNELSVNGIRAGNCTEIQLASTPDWTFVCCLLSLNVSKYDEWPADLVEVGMYSLDAVQTEFIEKSADNPDFVKANRFARESRAVGIGVLGFHSYLQGKGWPINGLSAFSFNKVLFKRIDAESLEASKKLAVEYGEPALMKGYGERFSHRVALAPTRSNAIIHGHVSESIQPDVANHYSDNSHKGNFSRRNQYLVKYLEEIGRNTDETWGSIIGQKGSVQHLEWMSPELKEVFKTAREIDQVVLIKLARDRQPYIDQAQSLNLFFASGLDTKYFVDLHLLAEEAGLKTLYYAKGASNLNVDLSHKETKRMLPTLESMESCTFCEG